MTTQSQVARTQVAGVEVSTAHWIDGKRVPSNRVAKTAALAAVKDGSLLVADDAGGTIWRISYTGVRK